MPRVTEEAKKHLFLAVRKFTELEMIFTSKGNVTVIGKGFSCIEVLYLLITSCNNVDTSRWRHTRCDGRT